jgi:cob(I)alamin adenosyltransferase
MTESQFASSSDNIHLPPIERPERATVKAPSLFIVNTGDGKGKTTAALGTSLRAVAQGWPVCVIQYIKSGRWKVGEERISRGLGVDWWTIGDGFTWDAHDMDRSQAIAVEAWRVTRDRIRSDDYRLMVLDEITYAINWGWIPVADVVDAITSRPSRLTIIATGRNAPQELVDIADTVTEMRNHKHAYQRGVRAIRGIDF